MMQGAVEQQRRGSLGGAKETLGPYAESSSLNDDVYRSILGMPGVEDAANVTYLTMQVRQGNRDVRAMVVGIVPGGPGVPVICWPSPDYPQPL